MKSLLSIIIGLASATAVSAQDTASPALNVVPSVDLNRYTGTWYEIARLPNQYQNDCAGDVTATYTLLEDGEIKVINSCRREDGTTMRVEGRAKRASEEEPNSKLKVRFAPSFLSFLPFVWGDYWIVELDSAYRYAVIGEPDRKYLWLLARTPELEQAELKEILSRTEQQGYDLSSLIFTDQSDQVK